MNLDPLWRDANITEAIEIWQKNYQSRDQSELVALSTTISFCAQVVGKKQFKIDKYLSCHFIVYQIVFSGLGQGRRLHATVLFATQKKKNLVSFERKPRLFISNSKRGDCLNPDKTTRATRELFINFKLISPRNLCSGMGCRRPLCNLI